MQEIVIKIPWKVADAFINDRANHIEKKMLRDALRNGKILPKKHGRLIDADAVLVEPFGNTYKDINIAETIIEADKEE